MSNLLYWFFNILIFFPGPIASAANPTNPVPRPNAFLSIFSTGSPNLGSINSPPAKDGSNGENGSIEPTSGKSFGPPLAKELFSFFFRLIP